MLALSSGGLLKVLSRIHFTLSNGTLTCSLTGWHPGHSVHRTTGVDGLEPPKNSLLFGPTHDPSFDDTLHDPEHRGRILHRRPRRRDCRPSSNPHRVLQPFEMAGLSVATDDPFGYEGCDDVGLLTGLSLRYAFSSTGTTHGHRFLGKFTLVRGWVKSSRRK